MQAPELFNDQEQTHDTGQTGVFKILPVLPQAYGSQRDEMSLRPAAFDLPEARGRSRLSEQSKAAVGESHAGQ
jgi:hypothetical protein